MKENEAVLERVYRVYPAHENNSSLEVGIDGDGMLMIRTTDKNSETYFGKVYFTMEPEVAYKIADAIKDLEKQNVK